LLVFSLEQNIALEAVAEVDGRRERRDLAGFVDTRRG